MFRIIYCQLDEHFHECISVVVAPAWHAAGAASLQTGVFSPRGPPRGSEAGGRQAHLGAQSALPREVGGLGGALSALPREVGG